MVRFFLPVIVLLAGCGGSPPLGITRCGLHVWGPAEPGFFDEVQKWEDQSIRAFSHPEVVAYDPRFADMCALLYGWNVFQVPEDSFVSSGRDVVGVTSCVSGYVQVANRHLNPASRFNPDTGLWEAGPSASLPHELGHVVQKCNPPQQFPHDDHNDEDHQGWDVLQRYIQQYVVTL